MTRVWAVVLSSLALSGCGTSATIHTIYPGKSHEAQILRSTASELIVWTPEGPRPIPRSEITDIDHPGDAGAVVGTLLLLFGVLNATTGLGSCAEPGERFICLGSYSGYALIAGGLGMTIFGGVVYQRSRRAARAGATTSITLAPSVLGANGDPQFATVVMMRY